MQHEIPEPELSLHDNLDEAEEIYADLVRIYPKDPRYLKRYAQILLENHREGTATEVLSRLHQILKAEGNLQEASQLAKHYPQIGQVSSDQEENAHHHFLHLMEEQLTDRLRSYVYRKRIREGQTILHQGQKTDHAILLLKGELALTGSSEQQAPAMIDIVSRGGLVASRFAIDSLALPYSAIANQTSTVLTIPRKRLMRLFMEHIGDEQVISEQERVRETVCLLSEFECMRDVPLDIRKHLASQSELCHISEGKTLLQGGRKSPYVYMIITGAFQNQLGKQDNITRLNMLKPLNWMGIITLFRDGKSPTHVVSQVNSTVLRIPNNVLLAACQTFPPLRKDVTQQAEDNLGKTMQAIADAGA